MLNWYEMEMQMRSQEFLQTAEQQRRLREMRTAQALHGSVGSQARQWLGSRLVEVGMRLQWNS
jgi:hypothetical protein